MGKGFEGVVLSSVEPGAAQGGDGTVTSKTNTSVEGGSGNGN